MTNLTELTAFNTNGTYVLRNRGIWIGQWDNKEDFDLFLAARGFSVDVQVVS